ncbi:MAG: hypothetical protein HY289_15670, partial [Planctomycetes bacterium]|nr:hypothetical protein [Planctomycetota bacterium]
ILTTCFVLCTFATRDALSQGKVARSISNEAIEKLLTDLNVKFQKGERKDKEGAVVYFDFTRSATACRLYNYGSDLWIETVIDKNVKLDDVNRWNAEAKFSRLVRIDEKTKVSLSLEAQLDCLGGVTDAMVRQYLNRFDDEAKKFAKFVK